MNRLNEQVGTLITPVLADMGYELLGIQYINTKKSILRIYIDSLDASRGVSLADCEKTSHQVSAILDVEPLFSDACFLEVSSPGIERPLFTLEHYARFLGSKVRMKLFKPYEGRRKFKGDIKSVDKKKAHIELITTSGTVILPIDMVEKSNLVVYF